MTDTNKNESNIENSDTQEMTLAQSITKNAIGLAIFAFITAGVIALTQQTTAAKIDFNIAEAQARALYEITPKSTVDNDLLNDYFDLQSEAAQSLYNIELLGPLDKRPLVYFAKLNQQTHTLIYPTIAPDGYTTAIKLLVGVRIDGTLSGVRIVDHKETPGLGDKIDIKKSDWVINFEGLSLTLPTPEKWKVKKDGGDFDQFTGATITPRAVVNAVKNTLVFHQKNVDSILSLKKISNHNLNKTEEQNP
jgi:electron transport complex protein RnfG